MADQDSNKINLPLPLSSPTPSWWDLHHHATRPTLSSTSLRNNAIGSSVNFWEPHINLSSSACDQEDVVSISASNHSSLTIDESSHRFVATPSSNYIIREPSIDNNIHVWSQFIPGVDGGSQEMSTRDGMGENMLNVKCFAGSFETSVCNEYLRKLESHQNDKWEEISGDRSYPISNSSEFFADNIDHKQSIINTNAGYNCDHNNLIENNDHQRSLNILSSSNPVSSWPIAQSDQPQMSQHYIAPHPCSNIPSVDENGYRPVGDNWRPREINMIHQHGYTASSNIDPFSNSCSKFSSKTLPNSLSLLDAKKQHGAPSNALMSKGNRRSSGHGVFMNEVNKKRSDDAFQSKSILKKPKRDNGSSNNTSSVSSSHAKMTSMRTPKGKVEAEKLSALQQIVSPYGKTDTASILQEAIGFIRSHQENVQMRMLSNPYMKSSGNKLQEAWGSLDCRKGERNKVLDLKSKGLCLVPISSIPQEIKEDNSGLDYWPAYRGYLYR